MARATKTLPIDWTAGVATNATGVTVGNKLVRAVNVLPDWRDKRRLKLAPVTGAVEGFSATGGSHISNIAQLQLGSFSSVLSVGRNQAGQLAAWRDHIALTGLTENVSESDMAFPAAIAAWTTLPVPRAFFGHQRATGIYQTTDGATITTWAPANVPTNATALIVHLERLWVAESVLAGPVRRFSRIWFTDTIDPDTIQPDAFFPLTDVCHSMFRTTPGSVGLGASSNMVFGCYNSFSVLDGDPTLGNSDLRILDAKRGLAGDTMKCETDKGAVVIANDGEAYVIPAGAQELVPIGELVRNGFAGFTQNAVAFANLNGTGHACLMYEPPYVYYFSGIPDVGPLILDLSAGQPAWWGPMDPPTAFNCSAATLVNNTFDEPARRWVAELAGSPPRVFEVLPGEGIPVLESGRFYEPGHDILAGSLTLLMPPAETDREVVVRVENELGDFNEDPVVVAASTTYQRLTSSFDNKPVRGAFLSVTLTGEAGRDLDPETALFEYHVCERQDPQR